VKATYVTPAERAAYSHEPKRERRRQVVIRVNDGEYDDMQELASRVGVSVSEAVRLAVGAALMPYRAADLEQRRQQDIAAYRADCRSFQHGHACTRCDHEACGWCPECHPEVPEW
jgi:hypothetical protein